MIFQIDKSEIDYFENYIDVYSSTDEISGEKLEVQISDSL